MQVKQVMTEGAKFIDPNTSIKDAALQMKEMDVGALPVGENDRLVGMITDRDIAIRSDAEGHDPNSTTVSGVMTKEIVYIFDDQDITEAANLMKSRKIRRLVVLNRDKRLSGMLSLGDLAVDADDERICGETLKEVSKPAQPRK